MIKLSPTQKRLLKISVNILLIAFGIFVLVGMWCGTWAERFVMAILLVPMLIGMWAHKS